MRARSSPIVWGPLSKERQEGETPRIKAETFVEHLAVPGDRAAVGRVHKTKQASLPQRGQGGLYGFVVVGHHGVAVGSLVARHDEGIDRQADIAGALSIAFRPGCP